MIAVNFLQDAPFVVQHFPFLRHARFGAGYSDTIMPQFFFAVGYAYRLTFLRRLESEGARSACLRVVRRSLGLLFLGLVFYGLDLNLQSLRSLGWEEFLRAAFQREFFQTLTHIGLTVLWILPVIALRGEIRLLYAVFSLLLFSLLSHGFYFDWALRRPVIDGGPLGFLSWSAPMLAGAWACDVVEGGRDARKLPVAGAALMALGLALSGLSNGADPWAMSQRAGTASYQIFGAGFSLLLYAAFVWVCDRKGRQSALLTTFGVNALAAYILDGLISQWTGRWTQSGSVVQILFMLSVQFGACYLVLRTLQKKKFFLRI
jgi:predicted acyltransferase